MKLNKLPPLETLREALRYVPETGEFFWRAGTGPLNRRKIGGRADYAVVRGYRQIALRENGRNRPYYAHRIAFLLTYGREPVGDVDHINGDCGDNRIANLREAHRSQNNANQLHKGVRVNSSGKWEARISVFGKRFHLGTFNNRDAALLAYARAAQEFYGEYARTRPPLSGQGDGTHTPELRNAAPCPRAGAGELS